MARAVEAPRESRTGLVVFLRSPDFLVKQFVPLLRSLPVNFSLSFISFVSSGSSLRLQYTMLFTSILLATAATFAAAQSTSTTTTTSAAVQSTTTTSSAPASSSSCAAQQVLDACLGTEQALINSCQSNDYSCLCNNYGNLLTCYANCPNDPGVTSVQQFRTQYCSAASAYGTTTLMVAPTSTSSSASTTESGSATDTAAFGSSSASNTAAAASASASSGAAAHIAVDVLGFLAAGAVFFL